MKNQGIGKDIEQGNREMTSQNFSAQELQEGLGSFFKKGFSHIRITDISITKNKSVLLKFLKDIAKKEPLVLFEFYISIEMLEKDVLDALFAIGATVLIPYKMQNKKLFSKRIAQLNNVGFSFGFLVEIDNSMVKNRKDFARLLEEITNYYPNHVYFSFTKDFFKGWTEKEADLIQELVRSFELFYTEGRAVPWFKSLLLSVKISAYAFISDFYEWLILNNYIEQGAKELPEYSFTEILNMQEKCIHFKLEEKNLSFLFPLIEDILRLHAAFSQVLIEGEEKELDLRYHPEDILNQSAHFLDFYEKICVENNTIRIYLTEEGIDYTIL